MIQILDVTKRYDDHMALRDVTVSVEKGEMVFLTGPSGAGPGECALTRIPNLPRHAF